jgi:hypothetical protein
MPEPMTDITSSISRVRQGNQVEEGAIILSRACRDMKDTNANSEGPLFRRPHQSRRKPTVCSCLSHGVCRFKLSCIYSCCHTKLPSIVPDKHHPFAFARLSPVSELNCSTSSRVQIHIPIATAHNNKNKFVDCSFNTMCNPNSSIANRRFRSASFQKGGTTSLLTQRLMGSLMSVTPTLGTSKKDIPKLEYRDYSVSATKVVRDDDPFELEFSTSLDGLNGSNGFADRVPYSYSAISGYLEEPSTEDHLQQSGFEASSVPPLVGRKTKAKRKRKPQQPGLTAKVRRPFKP